MDYAKESLRLHEQWGGKIEVNTRVPVSTKDDLSLAYTPGVAQPCLEIQRDPDKSYTLTRRHNLCAVITDGSAVLGLGDIGPEAGMPVMEGKCVLFKAFADVDAFPLCIRTKDVDEFVRTVYLLSGSFGGINLEDISAPRCFEIERKLKQLCDIPVFHDDQHGTAIITLAGLTNALRVVGKRLEDVKIVLSGAGAAAISISKLLLRAGMVRKLTSGVYIYLPLGLKALENVQRVVREEMDAAGFSELLMPMVIPGDLWKETGRWEYYGKELLRFKDRNDRDYCLGPTHEEVITDLVRGEVRSYRQLPVRLYQIQTKFRDEIRPRFGLMRGREFVMKDAYSFDSSDAGADESYKLMYDAYCRIFKRLGLRFRAVEADTGSIGGNFSHEFMVLADTGEDTIAACTECSYAANVERAEVVWNGTPCTETCAPYEKVATPAAHTVEEVSAMLKVAPSQVVKTMLFVVDGKIWIRNYQISEKGLTEHDAEKFAKRGEEPSLTEIGPRMVLEIIRIFDDSFTGKTLYENPNYVSPTAARSMARLMACRRPSRRNTGRRRAPWSGMRFSARTVSFCPPPCRRLCGRTAPPCSPT